jgi:DNA-directed RNA polymerase subunit M/transcription elongation factor TFIIS
MTDIASRLESIRATLSELREQLAGSGQSSAADRIGSLADELEAVIGEAKATQPQSGPARKHRAREPDVDKCPRCTIRSLHMVPRETRPAEDGEGEEVLWHCSSCGYEVWRADD